VLSGLHKELKEDTADVIDVDERISQLGVGEFGLANQVIRWTLPSLTFLFLPSLVDTLKRRVATYLF